ncbi:MAG: hypothetical protein M1484_03560 [Patescibacteria group bacterium]|nr:hypothetical protein [Patescibacteria group bacterium]MCL5432139.1 hypothetical protein [Patescibacteria group bacterium]
MDKEKIITVVIGLAVGVTAAGGYFLATKYLPDLASKQKIINVTPAQQVLPAASPSAALTVTNPDDYSSTTNDSVTVAGQTAPGAKVIIFANIDDRVASADAQGNFSADIKLEEGENIISVTTNNTTVNRDVTLEIIP